MRLKRFFAVFALLTLLVSSASAQVPSGEEVPYIKTPQVVVDKMLDLAQVSADDYLIDLGSGDGRIVISAAKDRGARGFGVELDDRLVEASNAAARKAGVAERAQFFARDLFATGIRKATVLTMYLLPEFNLRLRPRLLAELKPGTRVVSHDWDMGEWQPDAKAALQGVVKPVMPINSSTVYLWIVPAKVAGLWTLQLDNAPAATMEIEFKQRFQEISGFARSARGRTLLQSAGLRGADIHFVVMDESGRSSVPVQFIGRVDGDTMEGSAGLGGRWRAARQPR